MQYDDHFRALGATHVYDESFPAKYNWQSGQYNTPGGLFARYYFNAQGTEIGYHLACMDPFTSPHIHTTPRVWGIPHTLVPL